MTTGGSGWVSALCFVVAIAATLAAARTRVDLGEELRRPHPATVGLWLAVAVPSVLGTSSGAFYDAFYRDPDRVRSGQVWRLLTGSVVQDGGVAGAVFNLITLWLVASVAVAVLGPRLAVTLFVVGVLGFNLTAAFLLDAAGGGNSGATLFLGAAVTGVVALRHRAAPAVVAAGATLAAGVVLIAALDAHGLAICAGLVAGAALGAGWSRTPAGAPTHP